MFYTRILLSRGILITICAYGLTQSSLLAAQTIKPFETDGCSLFIDGTFSQPEMWHSCCVSHDKLYWAGGTSQQRLEADRALESCVQLHGGKVFVARMMYVGARFGGHPLNPAWFRWGYGWPYYRGYQKLTDDEQGMAGREFKNSLK